MIENDYPPLTPEQMANMSKIGIEWYNKMRDKALKEIREYGKINSVES